MTKIINNIISFCLPITPKFIVRLFANKYIAGVNLEEALKTIGKINSFNMEATVDILGEHTKDIDESKKITQEYIKLIKKISFNKLKCNISLKLTHIGYDINKEIMNNNIDEIIHNSVKYNNFIRLDMENHMTTDNNIKTFKRLKEKNNNVGIVFQAYLQRTYNDIKNLEDGSNIRLCKGIYIEPENIAINDPEEINENFLKLLKLAFNKNIFVGIATHDEKLIEKCCKLIDEMEIDIKQFEFQALYGVPIKNIMKQLNNKKYNMRIYVPYGEDWYKYSMRRLKENPNISKYIISNLFKRNFYR